jgi:hypothetical protein
MGFRVTRSIETINLGILSEFYVRAENVVVNRINKKLFFGCSSFPSYDDSKMSFPTYKEQDVRHFLPYNISNKIFYNEEKVSGDSIQIVRNEIDLPIFWIISLLPEHETDNLYFYVYEKIKEEYGSIFGPSNIIDEI